MRASERAYQALREEILTGVLEPGAVLTEGEVAERLGVSRTPVREALARLANDGLLLLRSRGAMVTEIEPIDISQLFDVRIALEVPQAALAATHGEPSVFAALAADFRRAAGQFAEGSIDSDAHFPTVLALQDALDAACSNPYLLDALAGVRTRLARVRRRAAQDIPRMIDAAREHAQIATAVAARDGDLAAHATHVHLANSLAWILRDSGDE